MIEKIEVNTDGDYNIKYKDSIIRKNGVVETYKTSDDLTKILNPNIIELLNSDECIHTKYVDVVESFDEMKDLKLDELRLKLNGSFEYDGVSFEPADINKFTLVMVGTDEEILSELPISTDGIYIVDTVEKVKELKKAYLAHSKLYGKAITDCMKAKTKADIEKID